MATKLVARLGADISDYAKQLTEAQRMMATRIANIRAGVREEIALARQVLREKEKLAKMGLDVDVAAARQAFQQRVELARATAAEELKLARKSSADVAVTIEETGKAATRAHGGFGRLSQEMVTVVRQMTGLPPVVAQAGGALGNFAIGAAPMLLILAGLAAVAAAFKKITGEARETAKAAKEAAAEVAKAFAGRQTAGDIDLITQQKDIGKQLDATIAKLKERERILRSEVGGSVKDQEAAILRDPRIKKFTKEQLDLQIQYDNVTTLLTDRRTERQTTAAEKATAANQKAATESAAAWRRAVDEIVENVRRVHESFEGIEPLQFGGVTNPNETAARFNQARGKRNLSPLEVDVTNAAKLGFDISALQQLAATSSNTSEQIKRLQEAAHGTANAFGAFAGGPAKTGGGLLDPLKQQLFGAKDPDTGTRSGGLLDPKAILNNALGGLASGGLSLAMGLANKGLNALAHSSFIFGKSGAEAARAIEEAAIKVRVAVADIRAEIASWQGDTAKAQFLSIQKEAADKLKQLGIPLRGIESTTSFEELLALIQKAITQSTLDKFDPEIIANLQLVFDWVTEAMKHFGKGLNGLNETLRNVPEGFKIALARFNATAGIADPRGGDRSPMGGPRHLTATPIDNSVHVTFEPGSIVQQPGEDGEALAKRVAKNVVRLQKRGGTTDFDLAVAR